jgi:hypothetical protein
MTSHVHIALKRLENIASELQRLFVTYSVAARHDPDMSNEGRFDKGGVA